MDELDPCGRWGRCWEQGISSIREGVLGAAKPRAGDRRLLCRHWLGFFLAYLNGVLVCWDLLLHAAGLVPAVCPSRWGASRACCCSSDAFPEPSPFLHECVETAAGMGDNQLRQRAAGNVVKIFMLFLCQPVPSVETTPQMLIKFTAPPRAGRSGLVTVAEDTGPHFPSCAHGSLPS